MTARQELDSSGREYAPGSSDIVNDLFDTWRVSPDARLIHGGPGAFIFRASGGELTLLRYPKIRDVVIQLSDARSLGSALVNSGIPPSEWHSYARAVARLASIGFLTAASEDPVRVPRTDAHRPSKDARPGPGPISATNKFI